jgi:NAD(P)-dependent dehydrogenase (short-subunit alcohol dehydrogenase family)
MPRPRRKLDVQPRRTRLEQGEQMGNRVWLVTGASRGIGAEIAKAVLATGDTLIAAARTPSTLAFLGDSDRLLRVRLDVTDPAQAADAVAAGIERFGHIDILVNNAGISLLGAVEETSADNVKRMFETNVFGLLNVTRAVLPHMRGRRRGHLVNIASVAGYSGYAGFGVYSGTKFAVEGLSEALHLELAPLGVHVTIVEPGFFRSDILDHAKSLIEADLRFADYEATAGAVRAFVPQIDGNQPGDSVKLAYALIELVNAPHPPLRLPLGTDCLQRIAEKDAVVQRERESWRALAASTDL